MEEKLLTSLRETEGMWIYAYDYRGEIAVDTECPKKATILRCLRKLPRWITSALEEGNWVRLTDAQYDPTTQYIKLIGKVITPMIIERDEKWKNFYSDETGNLIAGDGSYILVSVKYKTYGNHEKYVSSSYKEEVEVPCPGSLKHTGITKSMYLPPTKRKLKFPVQDLLTISDSIPIRGDLSTRTSK